MKKGDESNIEMDVYVSKIESITKRKIQEYNELLSKMQSYK